MIIIIVIILVGIFLGTVGKAIKDLVEILKFAKSEENLNATKPFLLEFNKDYINEINECLNKDVNLYNFAIWDDSDYEEIEEIFEHFIKNIMMQIQTKKANYIKLIKIWSKLLINYIVNI